MFDLIKIKSSMREFFQKLLERGMKDLSSVGRNLKKRIRENKHQQILLKLNQTVKIDLYTLSTKQIWKGFQSAITDVKKLGGAHRDFVK